ncbi:MAG: hypothetical protein V2A70_06700 [Candidatus Omnitrophota bacterium]
MIPLKEFIKGPSGLPSLLGYFAFVDEGVLLNHDGSLTASFYYSGPDMESSLGQEEDALATHVNNIFLRFGTGWAVHVDLLRVPASQYPDENFFNNPTGELIEARRKEAYQREGTHYENVYAVSLSYIPSVIENRRIQGFFVKNPPKEARTDLEHLVHTFNVKLGEFAESFSNKLELHRMNSAEMMTFLHRCVSGEPDLIPVPECPIFLNHYIGAHEFIAGHAPRVDEKYIGILTFTGFPANDFSGAMNILSGLPFEYRYSSRFLFLDPLDVQNMLKEYENKHAANKYSIGQMVAGAFGYDPRNNPDAANRAVITHIEEIKGAQHMGGRGDVTYGYYTGVVVIFDRNKESCDEKIKNVRRILNNNGYYSIIESMNAVEAFLGSLPGETVKNVRKPIISTQNLANMIPLTDIWTGLVENPCQYFPEKSPPLFYAATMGTTPFRFHLHVSDVGHTLVLGPTGGGKSVLLSHIANSALRYENAQVFFFDKGYSQFALTHALGGCFYDILDDDGKLAFCPLAKIDDAKEQIWASEWIEQLVKLQDVVVTPQIRADIDQAIRDTSKTPSRTLSDLYLNTQNQVIQQALSQFVTIKQGFMAGLLDAKQDGLQKSFWQTFEISRLMSMDSRRTTPVLLYLFHQIQRAMDGRPTFVIIDEGWMIMLNDLFMDYWIEFLRTARKNNACIILATQSLSDVVKAGAFSVINESCPTKIFLPNPAAKDPDCQGFYEAFGLNERQVEIIAQAESKRQYYFTAQNLGDRLIDLGLSPLELAFYAVGAAPADRLEIKKLQEEHGAKWVAQWLRQKGLKEDAHEWLKVQAKIHDAA